MDVSTLEHELRAYRPAGMTHLPAEWVWPRYAGLSLGNLPATIAQILGAELSGILPPLRADLLAGLTEGVRRVVLVVLDGLGWVQLQRALAADAGLVFHELAARGRLMPLTTVALSTTNNVLSTLRTGASPARHGLLAYELYLREWQMAVECITFAPVAARSLGPLPVEAETFLPVPSLATLLAAQGIPTDQVIINHLRAGPLSGMFYRDVRRLYGHFSGSDFWATLRRVLSQSADERLFLSGYWSAVDTLAHHYGPEHPSGMDEVRSLSYLLRETFLKPLTSAERAGTLLLVTADHGQVAVPAEQAIVLAEHPYLRERLLLPTLGEARVPFFYTRGGQRAAVQAYLEEHFAKQMVCFTREAFLQSGLLGPDAPYGEVPQRLGDLVGVMLGQASFARDPDMAQALRGRHGGFTPEEMLVPLLAVRLDA